MANDLKKVGLVFNADGTVDFVNSLKSINSNLKENYENFKLVQAQWNDSTKTSDKLKDKLDYLNNAYDVQSNKVFSLRKELEELENTEIKDENAIQKKKIALTQAETSLQKYQNQISETSKKIKLGTADLADFSKKLTQIGNDLTSAGKKMSIFTAAYVAGLGLAVKSAIEFESAFAGVEKTVDATSEQLSELKQGIRDMAKEMPATTSEISQVAEAAGQLGIKTDSILGFTKVMIDLGESTNLSSNEAADALAKFANITQMSQKDFDRLGSTIVALGNNGASTEKDITEMALRLAGAGKTVGMTEANILSFANALSSVGIEAEAGGSAFSKVMVEIESLVATNSKSIKDWATIAGMSTSEFKKAWQEDASGALIKFIEGLGKLEQSGGNSIVTLEKLGITEVRMRDALLRASNAGDLFSESLKLGNIAWEENNALQTEAEKRYATTESQMQITKNTINDMAITIGEKLLPHINKFLEKVKEVLNWFSNLNPEILELIITIGGIIAVIGPLLIIIGKIITGISGVVSFIAKLAPLFATIKAIVVAVIGVLNVPILIITAIVAAIVGLVLVIITYWEQIKEFTLNLFNSIKEALTTFFTTIFDFIKTAIDNIISFLSIPFDFLKNAFILIIALIAMTLEQIWNFIKPFVDTVIEIFKTIWNGIQIGLEFVKTIFNIAFEWIKNVVITPIVGFFTGIFNNIWGVISGVIEKIKSAFGIVRDFVVGIFEKIKETVCNIFNSIASIIKTPINGVIGIINGVLKSLNKIKIPDWVPGIGGVGVNFSMIPFLAKGGDLINGSAVVAEAGPELLLQQGNSTKVLPLTNGGGATPTQIIDYKKLGKEVAKAMSDMQFSVDDYGFGKFVKNKLLEVL